MFPTLICGFASIKTAMALKIEKQGKYFYETYLLLIIDKTALRKGKKYCKQNRYVYLHHW